MMSNPDLICPGSLPSVHTKRNSVSEAVTDDTYSEYLMSSNAPPPWTRVQFTVGMLANVNGRATFQLLTYPLPPWNTARRSRLVQIAVPPILVTSHSALVSWDMECRLFYIPGP